MCLSGSTSEDDVETDVHVIISHTELVAVLFYSMDLHIIFRDG